MDSLLWIFLVYAGGLLALVLGPVALVLLRQRPRSRPLKPLDKQLLASMLRRTNQR